jgi:hypothetical protein
MQDQVPNLQTIMCKIKEFYTSISTFLDSGEETKYSVWTATKQIYIRKIWHNRGGDYSKYDLASGYVLPTIRSNIQPTSPRSVFLLNVRR